MRSPILTIGLEVPNAPEKTNLEEKSWLLRAFSRFPDQIILGFGAPGLRKDESLGRLFSDFVPTDDGEFALELGAILLDRLPTLEEQADFSLNVPTTDGDSLQLCLSNQMTRLRYKVGDDHGHALCPSFRLGEVLSEDTEETSPAEVPAHANVEYLPTMATCRFQIAGDDAEDALEEHIEDCFEQFTAALNRIVSAHLMLPEGQGILTPAYDRGSFDYVYLVIRGGDPNKIGGHRLSPNAYRAALTAPSYDEAASERYLAYVNGVALIDDVARILRTAKSYLEAGLGEFALLQLAIAAEIATSRTVSRLLEFAGVSRAKLREQEKDMTFSRMLNVDLMALCPPSMKPDRDVLGSINRIRTLRNDLMHRANFAVSTDELRRLHEQAEKHVDFLSDVRERRGLGDLTPTE